MPNRCRDLAGWCDFFLALSRPQAEDALVALGFDRSVAVAVEDVWQLLHDHTSCQAMGFFELCEGARS